MIASPEINTYEEAYSDLCTMASRFLAALNSGALQFTEEAKSFWQELRALRNEFLAKSTIFALEAFTW